MIFKISVRLEEPLKMKTKVKIDSNNLITALPFESLIVQAKPNDPEGNFFEIKLNTKTELTQQPKDNQNGFIRNLWQKIHHHQPKEKPNPTQPHIIMTTEQLCRSNNNSQGGEIDEKNKDPETGS